MMLLQTNTDVFDRDLANTLILQPQLYPENTYGVALHGDLNS